MTRMGRGRRGACHAFFLIRLNPRHPRLIFRNAFVNLRDFGKPGLALTRRVTGVRFFGAIAELMG